MNNVIRKIFLILKVNFIWALFVCGLLGILIFGLYLRLKDYEKIPFAGQSLDEYSYAWVGLSLIEGGMPIGVSGLSGYKNVRHEYINPDHIYQSGQAQGKPLVLNYPWFDHPPLMGLITGGFAYVKGSRVMADISIAVIRKPMVWLSIITLGLVIMVAWIEGGVIAGLISGLIYSVSSVVIISSRMVQGENGWLPFYLLVTMLVGLSKRQGILWYLALTVSVIGMGFKLTGGVSLLFMGVMVLIDENIEWKGKVKRLGLVLGAGGAGLGMFGLYGAFYGWEQFVAIQFNNLGRVYGIGTEAIYNLVTTTKITNLVKITDPWILAGWICWLGLWFDNQEQKFKLIKVGGLAYLMVYLLMGSYAYGWYHIPLYPFLVIAVGIALSKSLKNGEGVVAMAIILLMVIGVITSKVWSYELILAQSGIWKLVCVAVLGSSIVINYSDFRGRLWVIRALLGLMILCAVFLSWKYFMMITVDSWYRIG